MANDRTSISPSGVVSSSVVKDRKQEYSMKDIIHWILRYILKYSYYLILVVFIAVVLLIVGPISCRKHAENGMVIYSMVPTGGMIARQIENG